MPQLLKEADGDKDAEPPSPGYAASGRFQSETWSISFPDPTSPVPMSFVSSQGHRWNH